MRERVVVREHTRLRGAGAIVFVLVFAVGLGLTLGSPDLPPGRMLYGMLGVPELSFPLLGVVIGVFNGVVYGSLVWMIFTLAARGFQ